MKIKRKLGLAALLFSLSWAAHADNCDITRNTFDDIYCTNKLYASADRELNKNYQLLRGQLTAQQKTILKRSQIAWIKERDQSCTIDSGVNVECRLNSTQNRNHWLQERLRECNTIGCKTSALH
ncbi:lysozyme inhibitor LprI family protein [Acinetobacter sp. ANC 4641]|uniref:lysozyme inhibitor LprI family protein n=1 Tax=Acinetobacter sp. ANC 4641 TaxID=2529847 RepID=UPI00148EDA6D|nr:lysozyme inhibitor LprI family protein [Acinetobacter sp. ANC 4641]